MLAAALTLLLLVGPALVSPLLPLAAVPAEPGAATLTDAPVFQAVAADLDGDGAREIVALVRPPDGLMAAAAWRESEGAWAPAGEPVQVQFPGSGPLEWAGTPARLLVRSVEGADVVSIVRQPRARELDLDSPCCMLLDDLVLEAGALQLVPRIDPIDAMDALHALDLDGDGTDELVATRSIVPLGDISYPTAALLLRWTGSAFDLTPSRLSVGSGDTPFVLGDTDGVPGEELGIIATLGRPELHRVRLGPDDALLVDDARLDAAGAVGVTGATAVPIGTGRGIAVMAASGRLAVNAWPAGEAAGPVLATTTVEGGSIIAPVRTAGTDRLAVRLPGQRLRLLRLPDLQPDGRGDVTWSPGAMAFASGAPVVPYVGPLPGGGADDAAAIAFGGRLVTSGDASGVVPFPALAGAQPIGLVGTDRATLAILHGPSPQAALHPQGGRLDVPTAGPGSAITVAPASLGPSVEPDGAPLEPPISGTVVTLEDGTLVIGPRGFRAAFSAPPGSRVYLAGSDPSVVASIRVVPASGQLEVPLVPPPVPTEGPHRFSAAVTTPAGHGYLATWEAEVADAAPALDAALTTPFGSADVVVTGATAPYATVTVDGSVVPVDPDGRFEARIPLPPWPTDVAVSAADPFGNAASRTVSGVGWFDYRGLPWPAIAVGALGVAAVRLFLRVPATVQRPRAPDDDAILEEIDPDDAPGS